MRKRNNYRAGDKFYRLTLIKKIDNKWQCLCDCGKKAIVLEVRLNKCTKSCGCLLKEYMDNLSCFMAINRRKYEPAISSARIVWSRYYNDDKECDISFEQFYEISQQDCFYCGCSPSKKYNCFAVKSNNSPQSVKDAGTFTFNGLDRINSNKPHKIDNVVACCNTCNRAKSNRSIEDFHRYIRSLKIKENVNHIFTDCILPKYYATSVRKIFYRYKDGDLTLQEFWQLTQQNCHYCDAKPFNRCILNSCRPKLSIEKSEYYYNGLDRINSNSGHNKDNVVACCKYCNFAKERMELENFNIWIKQITEYQNKKEATEKPPLLAILV